MTPREKLMALLLVSQTVLVTVLVGYILLYNPPTVQTRAIKIVDEQGSQRALLMSSEGRTALTFYDADGVLQATIGVSPDGSPAILLPGGSSQAGGELKITTIKTD